MSFLTASIFVMGVATVILSLWASCMFSRYNGGQDTSRRLTRALQLQLIGEAVIGLGTVAFACAAHFGWLDSWPIELQSGLRFIMFFATSTTTLHLVQTVNRIANG